MAAKNVLFFMLMITIFFQVSYGVDYKIGDDNGWINKGVDYKSWSASKTFHVGDVARFEYNKEYHNVLRVSHINFRSCNVTAPFNTFNSGNDSFIFKRAGHYFYICGFKDHCHEGQKVDIRVVGGRAQPPSGGPAISPASVPTPVPSTLASGGSRHMDNMGLAILVLASIFIGMGN